MRSILTLYFLITGALSLSAQLVATFEEFNLPVDSFLNNGGAEGGFVSGPVFLPNDFNEEFDAWSGWSISTMTDKQTPGFLNQYSAITGGGADGSPTYAVGYAFDGNSIRLREEFTGRVVESFMLTNSAYAYWSMLEGDAFSKRFGGETGDDPDFFLLTVRGYRDGALVADSVDFYLADYRFADNALDYIIDEWTFLDLSVLGPVDSLAFFLSSSDVSPFGMNTPAYFCIDNLSLAPSASARRVDQGPGLSAFPNPAGDWLAIEWAGADPLWINIADMYGRVLSRRRVFPGFNVLALDELPGGMYTLFWRDRHGMGARRLLRQ
jgi:hypothetical protein